MLGIPDPAIWSVYLLCIASTLLCLGYGFARWNQADEPVRPEDVQWAEDKKEVEKKL